MAKKSHRPKRFFWKNLAESSADGAGCHPSEKLLPPSKKPPQKYVFDTKEFNTCHVKSN